MSDQNLAHDQFGYGLIDSVWYILRYGGWKGTDWKYKIDNDFFIRNRPRQDLAKQIDR